MLPAIGYAIREQNRYVLDDPAISAAEITFERADAPLRVNRYIQDMDFAVVSVHALKLSVASPDPPGQKYLMALKEIAEENGACSISDHLGFTRDSHAGVEMGHFAPPPFTESALDATCRNVDLIQNQFGDTRFYLENIACLFRFKGTMTEAEFLSKVLQKSGCGWLLDVTNVYANARNFGGDPYDFIADVMPSAESVQMHLAGGIYDAESKMYIDSHSETIPDAVWDLYRFALERGHGKVEAVFVERDQNYPDENGWRTEIGRVREMDEHAAVTAGSL